jgi:hypothetical protein
MAGQTLIPITPNTKDNQRNVTNPMWRKTIQVPKVNVAIPDALANTKRFTDIASIAQSSKTVRNTLQVENSIAKDPPYRTAADSFSSTDHNSGKNSLNTLVPWPHPAACRFCQSMTRDSLRRSGRIFQNIFAEFIVVQNLNGWKPIVGCDLQIVTLIRAGNRQVPADRDIEDVDTPALEQGLQHREGSDVVGVGDS